MQRLILVLFLLLASAATASGQSLAAQLSAAPAQRGGEAIVDLTFTNPAAQPSLTCAILESGALRLQSSVASGGAPFPIEHWTPFGPVCLALGSGYPAGAVRFTLGVPLSAPALIPIRVTVRDATTGVETTAEATVQVAGDPPLRAFAAPWRSELERGNTFAVTLSLYSTAATTETITLASSPPAGLRLLESSLPSVAIWQDHPAAVTLRYQVESTAATNGTLYTLAYTARSPSGASDSASVQVRVGTARQSAGRQLWFPLLRK